MTLEEISYLVARRVHLVEEVSHEQIAQTENEEQDCCDQQISELTSITYKRYHVASTHCACYERAEAKR